MNFKVETIYRLAVIFILACTPNTSLAEEINLKDFLTSTGECSPAEKTDLQKGAFKKSLIPYLSYTISKAPIDRRKGASPPTGAVIEPLETVFCLAKDRNKILVTSTDPVDKSCGWIDEKFLSPMDTGPLSKLSPCGTKISPITVGSFCEKISKFGEISSETKKLTRFCDLAGVNISTIDTKFVTDNTTSRLYNQSGIDELVKRKIPLYLNGEANDIHESIDVFSLNLIYDVFKKNDGDLRVLLGKNKSLKGWADLNSGHVWYSNLSTYFSRNGDGEVYLGEIVGSQVNSEDILAIKPPAGSFDVKEDYAKFPVLFDMRKRDPKAPPSFKPQLQIAFIGKFCEEGGSTMCTANDNLYNKSLSNLRAADVVFLIDGSKSMREYFRIVADSLTNFTTDYIGNPDYKFGVAMYGDFKSVSKTNISDPIDFKVIRDLDPVYSGDFRSISNVDLMIKDVLKDKAEAVHAAVFETARSFSWSEDKPHFLIHIADHGDRQNPTTKVFNELEKNNIFYIPIAVKGEAILKESSDFIRQSTKYFLNYRTKNGNPMAVKAIVSYGDQAASARDNIATALVSATNVVSSLNEGSKSKSDILPTLGPAVRERFKIPSSDDIETLAAIGNIQTVNLGDTEKNWNYFVTLEADELYKIYEKTDEVCITLDSGDAQEVAADAILSIVQILTGDKKPPEELAEQIFEGSIPLQTATIIGDGMSDFLIKATTGEQLGDYQKEFCRTSALIESMQRGRKIKNPEDGKDLIWNGDFFEVKKDLSFKWAYKDELGQELYYVPIEYLPRPINQ